MQRFHFNSLIGRRHRNRLAASIAMILASPAHAADIAAPGPQAGQPAALEEVTVYARRLVPVARVAATVTVISDDDAPAHAGGRHQADGAIRAGPQCAQRPVPLRTRHLHDPRNDRQSCRGRSRRHPVRAGFCDRQLFGFRARLSGPGVRAARGDPARPGLVTVRQRRHRRCRRDEHADARCAARSGVRARGCAAKRVTTAATMAGTWSRSGRSGPGRPTCCWDTCTGTAAKRIPRPACRPTRATTMRIRCWQRRSSIRCRAGR